MKFANSKELNDYINELVDINELNLSISDLLVSIMDNKKITSKKEIEILTKSSGYSSRDIFLNKIIDYLDIDMSVEDNQFVFDEHIARSIKEVDINRYLENPYYKTIKISDIKDGNFELIYDHYEGYEIFPYLDMSDDNFIEKNSLGYFKDEFKFIALNYQGVTWMSITPNEIETMQEAVNRVQGDILVFGLGLGYFPFMASLKKEVKKITIIEKDQKIINLFKKHLLPQFPHREKIEIINDDASHYLNIDLKYDYAFIDLWHDTSDGIEWFLSFKKSEAKQDKCQFLYWLEPSFYLYLRRCFISLICESLEGYGDSHYQKSKTIDDKIINKFYWASKNLVISNKVQLHNLLSNKSLLDLLLNH